MKKLIITGATGFVAQQIVPLLEQQNQQLLLVGRDVEALTKMYPHLPNCTYADLAQKGQGYDTLLHLAAKNNDQDGSEADFYAANVTGVVDILATMAQANVPHLIFASSHHAKTSSQNLYAKTKGQAEALLLNETTTKVTILRLPAVYGTTYRGNLALVHKMPGFLQPLAFKALSALKPTVSREEVARVVLAAVQAPPADNIENLADGQAKNGVFQWSKRFLDILAALTIFGLLSWLMVIVWVLIRLGSSGPGLFAQERVGQQGKSFTCYKFRTMTVDTPQVGTHDAPAAAITGLGAFLRRTKIDELPQAWNILCNQMSLVGPRPCLPVQSELIAARKSRGVLAIKPGITGLAQVQGIDMSDPEKLAKVDMEYIARQGLILDISLIIRTALGGGQGDKVTQAD